MDERDIYNDFAHGDLNFHDAILRLRKIGLSKEDAEQQVNEWADALEADNQERWEQEMGF